MYLRLIFLSEKQRYFLENEFHYGSGKSYFKSSLKTLFCFILFFN